MPGGRAGNCSAVGSAVNLNHVTTQKHVRLLESLFLAETVQPWFSNRLSRLAKAPKLHFPGSRLFAALTDLSPERVRRDRARFGPPLGTFGFSELRKIATWSAERRAFAH